MMFVFVGIVGVFTLIIMSVRMTVAMIVVVIMIGMRMSVVVIMLAGQMNIEFYAGNSRFFLARNMKVITIEPQFLHLVLELMRVHAQIQQCRQKHIAADAAENIEVKSFHAGEKTSNIER